VAACSPVGVVVPSVGVSPRAVAYVARHRSIRAWRERWSKRRRCRGAAVPVASAWAGAGASVAGVAGIGPDPIDHHRWSWLWLVILMR
jgi:hypothetical protein